MQRIKLKKLLSDLKIEIKKVADQVDKTKNAANEVAKSAAASPSQSGDRFHSQSQAELAQNRLSTLLKLKTEIEGSLFSPPFKKVHPPCFVSVEFEDGRAKEYFLTNTPINLKSIKMLSTSSALGNLLLGKEKSEKFVFEIAGKTRSGKLILVE